MKTETAATCDDGLWYPVSTPPPETANYYIEYYNLQLGPHRAYFTQEDAADRFLQSKAIRERNAVGGYWKTSGVEKI